MAFTATTDEPAPAALSALLPIGRLQSTVYYSPDNMVPSAAAARARLRLPEKVDQAPSELRSTVWHSVSRWCCITKRNDRIVAGSIFCYSVSQLLAVRSVVDDYVRG